MAFVREWKRHSNLAPCSQYSTDLIKFIYSWPSWLRSQFSLCKHLIFGQSCPWFHQLTISRTPPLISIDQMSARSRANIENEDTLKKKAAMAEVSLPVPAYVDELTVNSEQEIKDLMDTVTWFHSHVLDLTAHHRGYAQSLYVVGTLLPRLKTYKKFMILLKWSPCTYYMGFSRHCFPSLV